MIGCGSNNTASDNNETNNNNNENETNNTIVNNDDENENNNENNNENEEESQQELALYDNTLDVAEELQAAWDNIEKIHIPKELPYPKDELTKYTTYFSSESVDDMSIHLRHKDYEQISLTTGDNEYQMEDDETELYDTINGTEFYMTDRDEVLYTHDGLEYSTRTDKYDDDELEEVLTALSDLEELGEKPVEFDFTQYPMPSKLPFDEGQEVRIEIFTVNQPDEVREGDNTHEFNLKFDQSRDIDGYIDVPDLELQLRDDEPPHFMNEDEGEITEHEGKEYFISSLKDTMVELQWFEDEADMYYRARVSLDDPEDNMDFVMELLETIE